MPDTCSGSRLPRWCFVFSKLEFFMKPVSRHVVNKHKSAKVFRRNARTTAAANVQVGPMRGGWRL